MFFLQIATVALTLALEPTKLPEMQQYKVPMKLKARDKRQKENIKFHANKTKPTSYRKFFVGQPVLILKQEKGKILQNFENKVYKVISQNHTSLKLQSESGEQTVSHKLDVPGRNLRNRQAIKMPVRFRNGEK